MNYEVDPLITGIYHQFQPPLPYTIIFKPNRQVYLRIKQGQLVIYAPQKMSEKAVHQIVMNHQNSIEKLRYKVLSKRTLNFNEGESIPLLGQEVKLLSVDFNSEDSLSWEERFYRYAEPLLNAYISKVLPSYWEQLHLKQAVPTFKLRKMSSLHGVYYRLKNRITFNLKLVHLRPELIDYVVVHELAHMVIRNHSPKFYQLVATLLPDYKQRIKQLKKESVA